MPRIVSKRSRKRMPEGWDLIEPTLMELQQKMRDVENTPCEGKRKPEVLWPIYQINHQKSRYIYELYHKKGEISRELYDYCLRERWADAALIAKWKKSGYERLCCLRCIQKNDSQYGQTCICRVPKDEFGDDQKVVECVNCGCKGCASGD